MDGIFGGISRPDIDDVFKQLAAASNYQQFHSIVEHAQGAAGLMQFLRLDLDDAPSETRTPATRQAIISSA